MVHSGLQFGGLPTKVGKQEQDGLPPMSLHSEFGPQGDGTHGFRTGTTSVIGGGAEIASLGSFIKNIRISYVE